MSRTVPTMIEEAALALVTCELCGQAPGDWCRVVRRWTGEHYPRDARPFAQSLHESRTSPIGDLHQSGYAAGYGSALEALAASITTESYGRWRLTSLDKVVDYCREQTAFWVEIWEGRTGRPWSG